MKELIITIGFISSALVISLLDFPWDKVLLQLEVTVVAIMWQIKSYKYKLI